MSSPPEPDQVSFRSPGGRLAYRDTRDHFQNGLLRLLHLDVADFERWLARAERELERDGADATVEAPLRALGRAFRDLRPVPDEPRAAGAPPAAVPVEPGPDGEPGALLFARLAETPAYGVARAVDGALGWLVRPEAGRWAREREPPVYEEAYFEGDPAQAGGYGDYQAQQGWRLEKARRQVGELAPLTGLRAGQRALDVGSGYGFFRMALGEAGVEHDGLEISAHARAMARRLYGFDSAGGTLAEHRDAWAGRYDLITLWDMLEHVAAPRVLLAEVAACLRPSGFVAIKTPNLDCPEAELFGPHYHSLKREHLVYFAAAGLHATARAAGLTPVHTTSHSHLLSGFVGADVTARWAADLRGADLTVILRR